MFRRGRKGSGEADEILAADGPVRMHADTPAALFARRGGNCNREGFSLDIRGDPL